MTRSPSRSRSRRSRSFDSRGEESHTLAVFNLYYRTDEDELRRIFERYGRIEKCNIVANRRSSQKTAFGFLTFEHLSDAREAKEDAHNMEIDGNIIRTDFCISRGGHDRGGAPRRRSFYRSPSRERRRARYMRDRSRDHSPRGARSRRSRSRSTPHRNKYRSPSPYAAA